MFASGDMEILPCLARLGSRLSNRQRIRTWWCWEWGITSHRPKLLDAAALIHFRRVALQLASSTSHRPRISTSHLFCPRLCQRSNRHCMLPKRPVRQCSHLHNLDRTPTVPSVPPPPPSCACSALAAISCRLAIASVLNPTSSSNHATSRYQLLPTLDSPTGRRSFAFLKELRAFRRSAESFPSQGTQTTACPGPCSSFSSSDKCYSVIFL